MKRQKQQWINDAVERGISRDEQRLVDIGMLTPAQIDRHERQMLAAMIDTPPDFTAPADEQRDHTRKTDKLVDKILGRTRKPKTDYVTNEEARQREGNQNDAAQRLANVEKLKIRATIAETLKNPPSLHDSKAWQAIVADQSPKDAAFSGLTGLIVE